MPSLLTVAGDARAMSWTSKNTRMFRFSLMRSPLLQAEHHVVVQHGIHVLDPHGVDRAVEDDPPHRQRVLSSFPLLFNTQ